ncbi:hydroxyphenylacetyl-CoA thioesterase PaaI [Actibacterium sp. XHP0104]|uniref:hydroxyphenylacetyl-CoA thioesterase PaaI n=1 Tax=Actibacterium sp. XHP0104 TaxID=2984335 RepID=UPI0021E7E0EF|nr:hydroxyphenylacetyl-CoA thioesterase PaaI [Actibacterium sp. XHP0104]MCV2882750.1 hydroxyphenylacetyl-CoA thioesterase PaaI [Actibacterium sp. XHP0104]
MTPQQLAEACAREMWNDDSASQRLGMELIHIAPGEATLRMTLNENMTNGHGNAHGGYLFTLADSAFAFACNTYNQVTVAQHCSITYLAPGALGDRLTATAKQVSRTGRSGIYDIVLTREDGTVLVQFRGHSRTINRTFLNADGSPVQDA